MIMFLNYLAEFKNPYIGNFVLCNLWIVILLLFQVEDSLETNPVNRISYIEVPPKTRNSNPYATPVIQKPNHYAALNKRNSQLNMSNISNNSYYSSVPVPVDMDTSHANHVSVSQNNTLRSTSKENLKRQYEIPWDLKKISDSYSTLNCSGSDLTMGYFANGRFYDPTPRQQSAKKKMEPEIYAPASSYSDRSNLPVFSTFTGGIPRNQSFSSHASTPSKYVCHYTPCIYLNCLKRETRIMILH